MTGANLLAYARWHAKDGLVRALAPVVFFAFMASLFIGTMVHQNGFAAVRRPGQMHDAAVTIYLQTLPLAMTLGALVVASGYVALDRDRGHVRFLFSTPVSAWRFYLLRYLVGAGMFIAAFALAAMGFSLIVVPVEWLPVVAAAAMYALLLGGLAMLAGAVTRSDGAVVVGVAMLASLLQPMARQAALPRWMEMLAAVLPPLDSADQVRTAWLTSAPVDPGQLVLVLGYGLGMLVASLVIISRAPLVR